MTIKTLGTNATNSIATAQMWARGVGSGISAADFAAINAAILDDKNVAHPIWPNALGGEGQLFIPHRGVLKIGPGDWIGVDSTGWPILLSANSIANGPWTHS